MMTDFRTLIDATGPDKLADWIGVSRKHIGIMKIRNSIPPVYWARIVAKKDAAVSIDDLARMYERRGRAA